MPSLSAPVVVMRFFRDESGYAFDQRIDQSTLATLIKTIKSAYSQPPGFTFRDILSGGRVVIGNVELDAECLDGATHRPQPKVIRCALLPKELPEGQENFVRQHLRELPLPAIPGPRETGLSVPIPGVALTREVNVPEPIPALSVGTRNAGAWTVIALLIGLDLYLQTQTALSHSITGWVICAVSVLAALCVYQLGKLPFATSLDLAVSEKHIVDSTRIQWDSLMADSSWLLLADGRRLTDASLRGMNTTYLPITVNNSQYNETQSFPGLTILQGVEQIILGDGHQLTCQFVRGYVRSYGQWRLKFAQWVSTSPNSRGGHSYQNSDWKGQKAGEAQS